MTVRRTQVVSNAHRLGYTRLYREDLEAIAQLLTEVGPLTITCDALEATEECDFADPAMPERPRMVTMSASNGKQRTTVELGRGRGRLVIEEPNTLTEGIRTRIEKICQGRFFDRVVAGRLINMSAFIALVLYAIFAIVGTATGVTWAADVSIALVSGYILIGFFVFRNQSEVLVINAYRADRPSFFRRTRDDWIVEIVVMFIGLLLGFLIGHLTK